MPGKRRSRSQEIEHGGDGRRLPGFHPAERQHERREEDSCADAGDARHEADAGSRKKLIAQESALDREFADRRISPEALARLTAQIGETQGQLRAVHLTYHLTTADLFSMDQRYRYAELRGYR